MYFIVYTFIIILCFKRVPPLLFRLDVEMGEEGALDPLAEYPSEEACEVECEALTAGVLSTSQGQHALGVRGRGA